MIIGKSKMKRLKAVKETKLDHYLEILLNKLHLILMFLFSIASVINFAVLVS